MMTTSASIELFAISTYKSRKSAFREALPQILAVCVKNVLVLAFGTSLGYPTILIPSLSSNNPDEIFHLDDSQISWISSINIMCVPIGSVFSGFVTQPYGRKRSMQAITFPFMASWIIIYLSTKVWHIYIALSISGVCGGLLLAPVLTYVAEITQPHLRGMLSATSILSIMLGVLLQFLFGAFFNWRTIALLCAAIPFLSLILLIFIPESPHWLIMNGRMKEARQNLAWLNGWSAIEDIENEFQEILGHSKPCYGSISESQTNSEKLNIFSKITKYYLRKSFLSPLILLSFCFFVSSFTGSATLQTYAIKIFEAYEVPINKYFATIVLGVAELLGTVISVAAVHYTGKRLLGLISLIGNGVCAAVIAFYAHLNDVHYFPNENNSTYVPEIFNPGVKEYNWIPFVFLILLAFLSQCGIINLPWVLIGEVFSKHTRAIGCGITCAISSLFEFSTNKIFLKTVLLLTLPGTYCFYAGVSILSAIILYFILPETEGKTLEEISDHFAGIMKLDNKVRRHNKNVHETIVRSGTYERIK